MLNGRNAACASRGLANRAAGRGRAPAASGAEPSTVRAAIAADQIIAGMGRSQLRGLFMRALEPAGRRLMSARRPNVSPPIGALVHRALTTQHTPSAHQAVSAPQTERGLKPAPLGSRTGCAAMAGSGGGTLLSLATRQRLLVSAGGTGRRPYARTALLQPPSRCYWLRSLAWTRWNRTALPAAGCRRAVAGQRRRQPPAASPSLPARHCLGPAVTLLQDEMLGSVRDAAGGAWSVLVLDPTTTKVRRALSWEAAHQQGRPAYRAPLQAMLGQQRAVADAKHCGCP